MGCCSAECQPVFGFSGAQKIKDKLSKITQITSNMSISGAKARSFMPGVLHPTQSILTNAVKLSINRYTGDSPSLLKSIIHSTYPINYLNSDHSTKPDHILNESCHRIKTNTEAELESQPLIYTEYIPYTFVKVYKHD